MVELVTLMLIALIALGVWIAVWAGGSHKEDRSPTHPPELTYPDPEELNDDTPSPDGGDGHVDADYWADQHERGADERDEQSP